MVRQKGRSRNVTAFAITFVAVFGVLSALTLLFIIPTGPSVYHFPDNMTSFENWLLGQDWVSLVPYNAIDASAINITGVRAAGLTSFNLNYIDIYQINTALTDLNVTLLAGYELPASSPTLNNTQIFILKPTPYAYSLLQQKLNNAGIVPKEYFRGFTIYDVINRDPLTGNLYTGRIIFYNGFLIYTQGSKNPTADIKLAISSIVDRYASLFSNSTVQRAIYTVMGGRTSFLSLYYLGYPTQISGSQIAAKAVLLTDKGFVGVKSIGFGSFDSAKQSFTNFRNTYLHGSSYYIMDNFDVVNIPYDALTAGREIETF